MPQKYLFRLFGGLAVSTILFCGQDAQQYSGPAHRWSFLQSSHFKGKAEMARYTGTVLRYGKPREAELMLITVLEPFRREQLVKSESDTDYYVIKQNQVMTYQTGVYPYRQMNSVFWELESGRFRKATMSTQEWCGQTYKELRVKGKTMQFFYSSYWENESRGYETIRRPGPSFSAFLYDELPLLIRKDDLSNADSARMFPMLMSSRVKQPDWDIGNPLRRPEYRPAQMTVEKGKLTWKGEERAVRIVTVLQAPVETKKATIPEKKDVFYVDLDSELRPLLRWERNDGGVLELQSLDYTDYWNQNDPGDRLPEKATIPQ
ncbi:MAG: hypothetical protein CMN76_18360 [Spirochaetaceae bacterium]|nr:hypothetical protein [Spirochaetaceae bacterium]